MKSLRRFRWVVTPSLISGIVAFLLAGFLLGSAGWAYISDAGLFYEQLFGAYGAVTILQLQPNSFAVIQNAVLNGPATYYVVLVTAGLVAGFSIYFILESISLVAHGASLFIREVHASRQAARDAARDTLLRLVLRISALTAWGMYWLMFVNVLVPLWIVMLQQSLDTISGGDVWGWVMLPAVFALAIISIHLHVTFARLVFLRMRLLGGVDAELSRIESEHS